MSNLATAILDGVKDQDLVVLNGNPFQGWDGQVTIETVIGGLYDRSKMVGDKDILISLKRVSINEVRLFLDEQVVKVTRYPALKKVEVHGDWRLEKYLQAEEIRFLANFLMENFHH